MVCPCLVAGPCAVSEVKVRARSNEVHGPLRPVPLTAFEVAYAAFLGQRSDGDIAEI